MVANAEGYEFRNADALTKWARWSVIAFLVVTSLSVISGFLEYGVLTGIRDDSFESQDDMESAAQASDMRQTVLGVLQVIVVLGSGIITLRWIHRANWNARALGATGLTYTPGWSIGWYFIPVMNFWKPYGAMKQIWQASADPADWQSQSTPALLGWWWTVWVIYTVFGNLSFRMSLRAEDVDSLISTNVVTQVADVAMIPACLLFLMIIQRIQNMQAATVALVPAETVVT